MMTNNYRDGLEFLSSQFDEVNGYDFYRDIFPDNENTGELHTDFSHPNAIYLYRDERDEGTKRQLRRRIMLKDTWKQDYMLYVEQNPMTLCSGLAYRRRANTLENAQRMHALVFDLDGVGQKELEVLLYRFDKEPRARTLPKPTYLVLSGAGLHVYYVFDEPIDLFPNIKLQMKQLKYDLTFRLWEHKATSQQKQVQYQSINQGFRMVGSINERYGTEVRAFRIGDHVTIDYINKYSQPENRVDVTRPFRPSKVTKAESAEKYPEWYQRVVVEGNKKLKKWDIAGQKGHNGDEIYNWWLNKCDANVIQGGHRYYFLMCLAIYASKCDIPRERLKKDMQATFEILKEIQHEDNEFTQADVRSALEAYSKEYYNFTIDDIEHLTNIRIERNKRNGQRQKDHLEEARAVRDVRMKRQGRKWTDGNGRPSARQIVDDYRQRQKDGKKADCIRETGLSKKTVYKWWNERDTNKIN